MHENPDRKPLLQLTRADMSHMSSNELLEALWLAEEQYKGTRPDRQRDHRRSLRRTELETVVVLAQRLVRERTASLPHY